MLSKKPDDFKHIHEMNLNELRTLAQAQAVKIQLIILGKILRLKCMLKYYRLKATELHHKNGVAIP